MRARPAVVAKSAAARKRKFDFCVETQPERVDPEPPTVQDDLYDGRGPVLDEAVVEDFQSFLEWRKTQPPRVPPRRRAPQSAGASVPLPVHRRQEVTPLPLAIARDVVPTILPTSHPPATPKLFHYPSAAEVRAEMSREFQKSRRSNAITSRQPPMPRPATSTDPAARPTTPIGPVVPTSVPKSANGANVVPLRVARYLPTADVTPFRVPGVLCDPEAPEVVSYNALLVCIMCSLWNRVMSDYATEAASAVSVPVPATATTTTTAPVSVPVSPVDAAARTHTGPPASVAASLVVSPQPNVLNAASASVTAVANAIPPRLDGALAKLKLLCEGCCGEQFHLDCGLLANEALTQFQRVVPGTNPHIIRDAVASLGQSSDDGSNDSWLRQRSLPPLTWLHTRPTLLRLPGESPYAVPKKIMAQLQTLALRASPMRHGCGLLRASLIVEFQGRFLLIAMAMSGPVTQNLTGPTTTTTSTTKADEAADEYAQWEVSESVFWIFNPGPAFVDEAQAKSVQRKVRVGELIDEHRLIDQQAGGAMWMQFSTQKEVVLHLIKFMVRAPTDFVSRPLLHVLDIPGPF